MKKEYNWRTGKYCVYKNFVHLVFVTKYRKEVFTYKMLFCMKDYMKTCCDSMNGELIEFGGESDHVHLMVSVPTKIALCNFAGRLKGYSSYQIRKIFLTK